jgi:hypothetical protein
MTDCTHELCDMETAIVDGLCPLCLRRKLAHANNTIERLENELRDVNARMLDYADRNAMLLRFGERGMF